MNATTENNLNFNVNTNIWLIKIEKKAGMAYAHEKKLVVFSLFIRKN